MNVLKKDAEYTVRTHSGYKGDEMPRSLVRGKLEWEIDRVLSRKRVIDRDSGRGWDEFECLVGKEVVTIRIFSDGEKSVSFPR